MARKEPTETEQIASAMAEKRERLAQEKAIIDTIEAGELGVDFTGWALVERSVWFLQGTLAGREGRIVLSSLRVAAADPLDAAVTSLVLRRMPVGLILARALGRLREEDELNTWGEMLGRPMLPSAEERERVREAARRAGARTTSKGRTPTPREFFDELALDALELAHRGEAVAPGLARQRNVSEQTAKRYIRRARNEFGSLDPRAGVWELGPLNPAAGKEEQ